MPGTSLEHGSIGANVFRYLDRCVYAKQIGKVYFSETGFQVGERVLKPDIAFLSNGRIPEDRRKASQFRQTWRLR